MSIQVTFMVLCAAFLNACWNTLVKVQGDRLVVMANVTLAGSIFSLGFAPFFPFPDSSSWALLALTIILHTAYHFFLPWAYDHGDLGTVYPIARGSAPLAVTFGALLFAGEGLSILGCAGVLCLTAGVMSLSLEHRANATGQQKAVFLALITGAIIATYTLVDGLGARKAGSPFSFAVWLTIGDGLLTYLIVAVIKRRTIFKVTKKSLILGAVGGILQVSSYWLVVVALSTAPMGLVSALRETSVLFVAVISTCVLKEGFGVWKFVSASLITLGLITVKVNK